MNKQKFEDYIHAGNIPGSGKASSYVRALDLLSEMLKAHPMGRPVTVWKMTEAMGRDPRTDIGISDHLRNVCGFEHGNPRRKEIADPYVLDTLKRWKCTIRFT